MKENDNKKINDNKIISFDTKKFENKSRKKKSPKKIIFFNKKDQLKKIKLNNKHKIKIIIITLALFFLIGLALFLFKGRRYVELKKIWEKYFISENIESSVFSINYENYENGFIRYSKDGVMFIDGNYGETNFNLSYNIKEPIISVNGEYFAIADKDGTLIYIFNVTGLIGKAVTTFPIQKISISKKGLVYVLQSDNQSNFITMFEKTGNPLDISIKSILEGDGQPIDFSTSNDGTELIVSYAYIKDDHISTKVVFYNFDEVGKNADNRRIVGGFNDEFDNKLVGRVHFFDDINSVAFYDGGLKFFSTKVLTSPQIIREIEYEEKINSITYDNNTAVVLTNNENDKKNLYTMYVYSKDGKLNFKKDIDFEYQKVKITKNFIVFIKSNSLVIYDLNGKLRFDKEVDNNIIMVGKRESLFYEELLIGKGEIVELMRFK